jgi:hypothetical protein
MICPTCHGEGWIEISKDDPRASNAVTFYNGRPIISCPDCGGHGIAHCCDGLREQPDES